MSGQQRTAPWRERDEQLARNLAEVIDELHEHDRPRQRRIDLIARSKMDLSKGGSTSDGRTRRRKAPMSSRYDPKTIDVTLRLLADKWPLAFSVYEQRRRPLALRIDQQITAALGDTIAPEDLTGALRHYVGNLWYLRSCVAGAVRVGLDGEPAGVVSEKEAAYAAKIIERRQAKAKAVTHGGDRKSDQNCKTILKSQTEIAAPVAKPAQPKRLGLADLKAAAAQRRALAAS
jgi:ProP effector